MLDKIENILISYMDEKKKCFINGMPEEEGGEIVDIKDDYVIFKIKNKAEKQEDATEEELIIPKSQIFSLSLGEKKVGTLSALNDKASEESK